MRSARKPILILALLCLCSLAGQSPAAAQGWANGCLNRRAITIDHTKVPNTDQANFAVLISGTYSYLAATANGGSVMNANGYDILFAADANGLNPLPFEQENYSPSTGAIVYWVKLPTVSHTADTVFYLFYGNSSISANQSNKTVVWDANYKGVWHLPNGSNLSGADSTSNASNLTNNNITAATSGQIDGAASFNGSNNYLSNTSLSIPAGSSITISFWNYVTSSNVQPSAAFTIGGSDNPNRISAHAPWSDGTLYWDFGNYSDGGRISTSYSSYVGSWTHVVLEYNAANTTHYIYLDGSLAASNVNSSAPQNAQTGIDIGAWPSSSYYHRGSIDEFRVSTIARSADWIATEYQNQSSPSTFYSVGSAAQGTMSLSITQLTPSTANFGDSVLIQGTNFGATQAGSTAFLNGTSLVVRTWSDTGIDVFVPIGTSTGYFTVTVGGQTAISPLFTVRPIQSGWSDGDIGPVGLAGSGSYSGATLTMQGAGFGTANTSATDAFHFVYQPLSGDGTIVARVVSLQGTVYPEAGVMIRETLDQASAHAYMCTFGGTSRLFYRTATGGANSNDADGNGTPPLWVKLIRTGSAFNGYTSPDGVNWTQVGTSHTISMAQNVYVGLAVSSYSTSAFATATFDNVSVSSTATPAPVITSVSATTGSIGSEVVINGSGFGASQGGSLVMLNNAPVTVNSWSNTSVIITVPSGATSGYLVVSVAPGMNNSNAVYFAVTTQPLPTPWINQDVGLVGIAGSATYANGTFTMQGAGFGTANTSATDAFHFVYQPLSGDGTIVARVVSLQGTVYPEAGVMIRETLDQASAHAYMCTFGGTSRLFYRTATGGANSNDADGNGTPPFWVKLIRTGSAFNGYTSPDGVNWTQVGTSHTISMAQNVYVGLAVSSYSTSAFATATFDNVSVSSTATPAPVITSVSATTGSIGSEVVINGSGFGASQGGSLVMLNNAPVTVNSWSNTSVIITVPSGATSGYLVVSVAPGMNNSNAVYFAVTTQPLPTPWINQDVGLVGIAGSATYANGTFAMQGAGFGTANTSATDAFHFVYQPLSGDGTIVARVVSLQGTVYPEAGVMIRETLDQASAHAYMCTFGGTSRLFYRTATGGANSNDADGNGTPPLWVKLIRTGSAFNGYTSPDGVNWTQVGTSHTISMAQNVYVGLAVSSYSTSAFATATFDNVSVSSTA